MTDGHRVLADPHLANEQAHDALTLGDSQRPRGLAHALQKTRDRGGQRKLGLTIERRGLQGVEFGQDRTLPSAHGGVHLAQLVERDEALLVGVEQAAHSSLIAGRLGPQGRHAAIIRGGVVGGRESAVDFGPDELRVLKQGEYFPPNLGVEFVGANRRIVADGALRPTPTVDAVAPVVINALAVGSLSGIAGVPPDGVAALGAHAKPLEQRRIGRLARREAPILRPPPLCPREDGRLDDGRNGQLDPFLARAHGAPGQAPNRPRLAPAGTVAARRLARADGLQVGRPPHIGLVPQNDGDGRGRPALRMARPDTIRVQPPRHPMHLETLAHILAHIEVVDAAHDGRLGLVDFEPRTARLGLADQAITVGRSRDHVQRTLTGAVDLPAPRPFRDLRALVLGDGRQHLP